MTTLTETQSLILNKAASRPRNIALPLPNGLAGAAAKMAVNRMIDHGWLEEVKARPGREPLWRETVDGLATTLVATEAGLGLIGIEPVVASAVASARRSVPSPDAPASISVRPSCKQAHIIALLQRAEGATVAEIATATGWQAHTVRGAVSGVLKKKLGLVISTAKENGRGSVYRIG